MPTSTSASWRPSRRLLVATPPGTPSITIPLPACLRWCPVWPMTLTLKRIPSRAAPLRCASTRMPMWRMPRHRPGRNTLTSVECSRIFGGEIRFPVGLILPLRLAQKFSPCRQGQERVTLLFLLAEGNRWLLCRTKNSRFEKPVVENFPY